MRRLILVTLCAVVTFLCSAQNNRVVNGVVFTVDGTPMSGAVLRPIGTQLSCTTNADGTQTLTLTLYHDRKGDIEGFNEKHYLSIPLWHYQDILNKGDQIVLQLNTYKEGMTSRNYTF